MEKDPPPPPATCPICLANVATPAAFIEGCLHHFCFQCIQSWAISQCSTASAIVCPACKRTFSRIISDSVGDQEYRLIKVDDLISAAAAAAASTQPPSTSSSTVFVLTPEHRRRRSLYIEQQRQLQQEELGISAKRDDQLLKLVTVSQLTRPAVSQFLHRELQSLLIGEDVGLVVYHVVGTLKHALESVQRKDQSSNKRGLASASAIEVVAVAAQPYLHQIGHARQLGVELIAFTVSGLNVEAYDAVIFPGIENNNITTGGDGSDDDDDDGRAEVEVEPSSDPTLQI